MAMAFAYQVLENSARNYILSINGFDNAATTAGTITGAIQTSIIAANGYTPTTSFKLRRIVYNTTACMVRMQWKASANVDFLNLSGYGFFDLWNTPSLINSKAAGATGDIDLSTIATATVAGATVNAAFTIVLEAIKGFK